MDRFKGKTALITGGTTGIGLATAKLFINEGARVIVTGRTSATIKIAQAELGDNAIVINSERPRRDELQDRADPHGLGTHHSVWDKCDASGSWDSKAEITQGREAIGPTWTKWGREAGCKCLILWWTR